MRTAMNRKATARQSDRGQGMTEYILIVVLVAILSISVTTVFGGDLRALYGDATKVLAGQQNVQNDAKAASQAQMAPGSLKVISQGQ